MISTGSDKFGLLLAHFFGNGKAALNAAGAAGLYGMGVETARSAMELLESEGILRNSRRGRGRADPAVVSVQVLKEQTQSVWEPDYFFGYAVPSEKLYRYNSSGLGSGVIVNKRGYVFTNLHVVEDAMRSSEQNTDYVNPDKLGDLNVALTFKF